MDNALARHVALATRRSKQGLDDLIELLQNHCDPDEGERLRSALAMVDQKYESLLKMVSANHPDVARDIAEKTQKFGRPI